MKTLYAIGFGLVLLASTLFARGGGGCFEAGTLIQTPHGPVPIEQLCVGDEVIGGRVEAITQVMAAEYLELPGGVRVTAEHPFQVGPGIFRTAERCFPTARRIPATRPAYNLLVSPGGTYIAQRYIVHNKGCFLPDTPILRADGTPVAISAVRPGDKLLAFESSGNVVTTTVHNVLTHDVDEYLVVTTEHVELRVTVEHPFYVGGGTFKTLEALKPGDSIFAVVERASRPFAEPETGETPVLLPQRIVSLERVRARTRVYNLQTDAPNTYFANGIAVHNKGGGCFAAGTPIQTPDGTVAIERIRPGDIVLAGSRAPTVVEATFVTRSPVVTLTTDRGRLVTTAEHPLLCADGNFHLAGTLAQGDRLMGATVTGSKVGDEEVVYNLRVGPPHTFVANGFIVHNKGGGGGGGGYHGRSSGSGRPMTPAEQRVMLFIFGGVIVLIAVTQVAAARRKENQDLDFCYSRSAIEPKAAKTRKLLEFIARVDPSCSEEALRQRATAVFVKLQQCWQAREYEPMQPLLMPDLYAEHCAQLAGLRRNHEINLIEELTVQAVDIVNVRYTQESEQREFTVLITASARDYYVDDRTSAFLRGDSLPVSFQEFWTFHWHGGAWLLREIEQTRESDVLKEENFFEQFTDKGVERVYGDTAGKEGPAGPWLEQAVEAKATRIERLLNFLVQTDKLWNRQAMLERARQVFLDVMLARETGDPTAVKDEELFPAVAVDLRQQIAKQQAGGRSIEYRNLCVRKVELVLVRNFSDNAADEFTVRISAHAQRIVKQQGGVVLQDEDVTPFEEFWTYGRLDQTWKLKEVLPSARGEQLATAENVDEDSSAAQLQWYYRQTRA